MKKWNIYRSNPQTIAELQKSCGLSLLCCTVLVAKGYTTSLDVSEFMGCQELSSPFDISGMKDAAQIINDAVDSGKRICIYGDYDCDGIMATVILYSYLAETGANVTWRIPERNEGYGLNMQAVQEMHDDGVELIVTVDNGISALEEAEKIKELGMELIITDHHQPGFRLPEAAAIVDAHCEDNYSAYRFYCGAGIALLLVAAMNDGDTQMAMEQFGDLAAIATIADVVALTGENRFLVQRGMEYLEHTERAGLRALREISGLSEKNLQSMHIAFMLAPRINAAGRMASPKLAVQLLLEEDEEKALTLAGQINSLNTERKNSEAEILKEVAEQIRNNPEMLYQRVLVFYGENWHSGVIGIVASRLQEKYGKPCFMISIQNGHGHGSARSFGNFHVFKALTSCENLLEKFGGHPAAGGFTLKEENIPAFIEQLQQYAWEHHEEMPFMEISAIGALRPEFLLPEMVESLSCFEPFGAENQEPVFLAENVFVKQIQATSGGTHTRMQLLLQNQPCTAMYFRKTPEQTGVIAGNFYHMLVCLNCNTYKGNKSVTLIIQEVRPAGISQTKLLNAVRIYEKYKRKEELYPSYYRGMLPDRKILETVYRSISGQAVAVEMLAAPMMQKGINYCQLLVSLDVFEEMGLLEKDTINGEVKRLSVNQKVNLEDSAILKELRQLAEIN